MLECNACGSGAEVVKGDYQYRESGVDGIVLRGIELIRCGVCGNVDPVIPNLAGLMGLIVTTLSNKPTRLTGSEVRFLRKSLAMTGDPLCGLIGTDASVISKWESDSTPTDAPSEALLRFIVRSRSRLEGG